MFGWLFKKPRGDTFSLSPKSAQERILRFRGGQRWEYDPIVISFPKERERDQMQTVYINLYHLTNEEKMKLSELVGSALSRDINNCRMDT